MYFEQQNIQWNNFNPNNIFFKKGILTKGLESELNLISYKTKTEYYKDYEVGVFVQLVNTKEEFPNAHINFHCKNPTQGITHAQQLVHGHRIDNLVYLYSHHLNSRWGRDAQGNWKRIFEGDPKPLDEGYGIEMHNMTASCPRSFQEQIQIVLAVRKCLVELVLPHNEKKMLTKVA